MRVEIDGRRIGSEAAFHRALASVLDFGPYYGSNLAALWDRLSTDVPRPVFLIWNYAGASRQAMGDDGFDRIVRVLRRVEEQDRRLGWSDAFHVGVVD